MGSVAHRNPCRRPNPFRWDWVWVASADLHWKLHSGVFAPRFCISRKGDFLVFKSRSLRGLWAVEERHPPSLWRADDRTRRNLGELSNSILKMPLRLLGWQLVLNAAVCGEALNSAAFWPSLWHTFSCLVGPRSSAFSRKRVEVAHSPLVRLPFSSPSPLCVSIFN